MSKIADTQAHKDKEPKVHPFTEVVPPIGGFTAAKDARTPAGEPPLAPEAPQVESRDQEMERLEEIQQAEGDEYAQQQQEEKEGQKTLPPEMKYRQEGASTEVAKQVKPTQTKIAKKRKK